MANDLLITLEEKINEAIETIELSRMEVTDLKEQNEELENRYADWETKLSTLIEKFEQLEDGEDAEVQEANAVMEDTEEESEKEVEAKDALDSEDAEEVEATDALDSEDEEEVEATDALYSEDEEEEDSDEEELGSTFGTNADSFNEAPESAQHYA